MTKLLDLLEVIESPETAGEFIGEMIKTYKPVVYSIVGELFKTYKDLNNNDDYFAATARRRQLYLEAYLAAGFTREEAMLFLLDSDLRKERLFAMFKQVNAPLSVNNE